MALSPGTRLGQYEILSALGAGGMGEVYRARDPRLDREVAIKVLSEQLAMDPTAFARFEREALSVAKLSHPNILSIFEFGKEGGTAFVVTELVDGQTLRARLENGPLQSRRAIGYAVQIARGIAAAHARGIAHRDLKPDNVMITSDDQVKILDFGLAKSVDPTVADATRVGVATNTGIVLGTIGYMAPEQARGLLVDHRTDIFAFGAVLYEMLSGERAFKGETAADTMTEILTKDPPDLDTTRLSIPPALERIVRRCLEKAPDRRFQSANDLAFALENVSTVSTSTSTVAAPDVAAATPAPSRAGWLPWAVAAVAVIGAAASWLVRPAPDQPEGLWDSFTRISESAGEETSPAISPDGSTVAYAMRVNGNWDIYSQRVGGRNAAAIINDPQSDEGAPAFSPDGTQIAFHRSDAAGGIFIAGATGESVRRLTDTGFGPAWSPDGKQIAFSSEEIVNPASRQGDSFVSIVDVGGGAPRKLIDADAVQPSWSPSGERIVYWSNTGGQRDIFTASVKDGARVAVTNDVALDWSPVWSPDGRFVYFSSDRGGAMNLWRVAVDQSSGRVLGAPEPVTAGVQAAADRPHFSRDGSRMVFRSRVGSINPVAVPFDPVSLRAGTPVPLDSQNNIRIPSGVSADGKLLTYFSIGERQEDIFIGTPGGAMRRVTDDLARDRGPVFTPDGRSLVFYSNRDGRYAIWTVGVDGGGLRKVAGLDSGTVYTSVSPAGDRVVFVEQARQGVVTAPLAGASGQELTVLPDTELNGRPFNSTDWSRDGTKLAGILLTGGLRPDGVAIYDLAAHKTTAVAEDETGAVKWLADSRRVVYFAKHGSELVVLDTVSRQRTVIDVHLPGPSIDEMFAVSPDNKTIYYGASRAEADIWIAERRP